MSKEPISSEEFTQRLAQLCLSSRTAALPRRQRDRHILLKSLSLYFEPGRSYSESEINQLIERWLIEVGRSLELDHVTLRRTLIDERYLTRSFAGQSYRLEHRMESLICFAPEVDAVDSGLVIHQALEVISQRRARQTKQTGGDF